MNIQIGDRFTSAAGEWEVVSHPATLHGAKAACASAKDGAASGRTRRDVAGACESSDSEDSVSLFGDLNAFFTDHRHCGDLDAGVDGEMVRITYDCGARMARRVGAADDPH